MSDSPIQGRASMRITIAALGSLLVAAVLTVFGDDFGPPTSPGADGFSESAIGHKAFVELLKADGFSVTVSRHATAARAGASVAMFLEPLVDDPPERARALAAAEKNVRRLFVVLPKRDVLGVDGMHPSWASKTTLRPVGYAYAVLEALSIKGDVVRPKTSSQWEGDLPAPTLESPQLVRTEALTPLLATKDGILVGYRKSEDGRVLVLLSDPDVLATHGLGKGRNAELTLAAVDRVAGPAASVLVDETLHGFEIQPSLANELLHPPLVLATTQAALVLVLLAWAGLVRFGNPRPPSPALGAGSGVLVDQTATLLGEAGNLGYSARAYWKAAKDELSRRLRPGLAVSLERTAQARGLEEALQEIERRVAALADRGAEAEGEVIDAAREIHQFRERMTHGSDAHDGG